MMMITLADDHIDDVYTDSVVQLFPDAISNSKQHWWILNYTPFKRKSTFLRDGTFLINDIQ